MSKREDVLPVRGVIPIDQMFGGDEEDIALLRVMASEAEKFLRSFSWCTGIRESYFGDGYGGIVTIFFFRIEPARAGVDEWIWVVYGDLPSAYLVTDGCKTPSQALEGYIEEMARWVDLAKRGRSSKEAIPVNLPATPENAANLEKRLHFLSELVVPSFREAEIERA